MPPKEISVGLGLKDNLNKDLRKALGGIRSFASQAGGIFKRLGSAIFSVKTLIGALASGYVVRSFFRMANQVAKLQDEFHKLNLRLGISVKTLSELKYAGEQSGIKWTTFAMSLQRVVRRLEEFRSTGKGVASQALQDLGIAQAVLAGEKLEALLPRIAAGFQRMNESQRTLTAMRLFDSEGVAMSQLFGQGPGALAGYQAKAGRFGITSSMADATAAAGYNDAINSMSSAWEGLKRKALTPLFKVMSELIDKSTEYVVSIQPKIAAFFEDLAEKLKTVDLSTVASSMVSVAESMVSIAGQVMLLAPTLLNLVEKALKLATKLFPKSELALDAYWEEQNRIPRQRYEAWRREAARNHEEAGGQAGGGGNSEFEAWKADIIRQRNEAAAHREKWGGHPEYTPQKTKGKGYGPMATFWQQYSEGADRAIAQTQMVASGLYSVEDAFASLATKSQTWKQALSNVFNALLSDLTRIAFRMTIVNGLAGIGGLFTGAQRAADVASFSQANAQINSMYFPAKQLAAGGIVSGPASGYPVIMHGTEEVQVKPLGSRGGSDGVTHIHNYNINAMDAASMTQSWLGVFSQQTELVAHSVVNKIQRSPKLSGAIA